MNSKIFEVLGSPAPFFESLSKGLKRRGLRGLLEYKCDHICFRTGSNAEYQKLAKEVATFATLIVESPVNGRAISTFLLPKPLFWENQSIDVLELPAPKRGHPHTTGWEHVEFAVGADFLKIPELFSQSPWKLKGAPESLNPEYECALTEEHRVKCHPLSLREVIKIETELSTK